MKADEGGQVIGGAGPELPSLGAGVLAAVARSRDSERDLAEAITVVDEEAARAPGPR